MKQKRGNRDIALKLFLIVLQYKGAQTVITQVQKFKVYPSNRVQPVVTVGKCPKTHVEGNEMIFLLIS